LLEPTIPVEVTIVALEIDGLDPSELTRREEADLEETMFGFLEDSFEEGMTLLELRITNGGSVLSSPGDPFLFEVTAYTSPDYVGSRQLRNGLGFLYGAVTVAIQSGNSELISQVQASNPAFLNVLGILQIEPPSQIPSSVPSGFPTDDPSSEPSGFPIGQPSSLPTNSHNPTMAASNNPSSLPTLTSPPTQSLLPTADVAPWMVEMLKRVNFERERGNYVFISLSVISKYLTLLPTQNSGIRTTLLQWQAYCCCH